MIYVSSMGVVISIVLLVYLIMNKETIRSSYLLLLSFAVVLYQIGNFIELVSTTLEGAQLGLIIRFIGVPFIPTIWLFCVWEFCVVKPQKKYRYILLWLFPTIFCLLFIFWPENHLFIESISFYNAELIGVVVAKPGILYIYFVLYQMAINLWGVGTLIYSYREGTPRFRKQANLLFVSVLIPVFNIATYHFNFMGYYIDITPYTLLLSMIVFTIALYKFGVFNYSRIIKDNTLDNLPEGILLFDKDGIYIDSNIAAKEIFEELSVIPFGMSISDMDYLPFGLSVLQDKDAPDSFKREFTREHNGVIKTFTISDSAILKKGKVIGHSFTLHNITPLKNTLTHLEEKSITDSLTGIYNRAYWFDLGESFYDQAVQGIGSYCVIMFDIDHFKSVNDNFGHVFGDYVLATIAKVCANHLRKTDVLARYGGEEFCILLHNSSFENAANKAERLRKIIADFDFSFDGKKTNVTVSFGVAQYLSTHNSFIDCVKEADVKLYAAKIAGRNRVCT